MRIVSWNIDGLNATLTADSNRAKLSRATLARILEFNPDVIAIQETKLSQLTKKHEQKLAELLPGYKYSHNMSKGKKGYAGTMMLYKDDWTYHAPHLLEVDEGRLSVLENDDCYIVNVYTPNAGSKLIRLDRRMKWDVDFANYMQELMRDKPVIIVGDLNVAHTEIDLKYPKGNERSPGFTHEERTGFDNLLSKGFVDTFRLIHGDVEGRYTWWSQVVKTAKLNNSGWRIDYALVDERIADKVSQSEMINSGERADHCPILLDIEL